MKLLFREDIDRDIWNWQDAISKESYGIQWKQFLPPSITADQVADKVFLKHYLEKEFYASGQVSAFKLWLEDHTDARRIEEDLTALMQGPFLSQNIVVYVTTFHRAPYDVPESSFFLIRRTNKRELSVTAIYHELMHFLFHWHYWGKCEKKGLSEQEIHDFKESLTVLLDPILEKRGLPPDGGYPMHKGLRKQWTLLYEEDSNFPIFIEKALVLYKSHLQNRQKFNRGD